MSAQQYFFGFTLVFQCLLFVVFVPWFWVRREHQPIRARHPTLVLVPVLFASVLSIYVSVFGISNFETQTCLDVLLPNMFCFLGALTFYLLRILMLFVDYRAGKQATLVVQRSLKSGLNDSRPSIVISKIFRFRKYLSTRGVLLFGFIWFLVQIIILVGVMSAISLFSRGNQLKFQSEECFKAAGTLGINSGIYWFVQVVALSRVIVNMKEIHENFYIKKEFFVSIGALTCIMIAFFCDAFLVPGDIRNGFNYSSFLYNVFPALSLFIVSVCFPLWKSYTSEFSVGDPNASDSVQTPHVSSFCIDGLLANPAILQAFKEFLIEEFSSENMLFIEQVTAFRSAFESQTPLDEVQARSEAKRIYELFCTNDSPLCINISGPCRARLSSSMKEELNGEELLDVFKSAFVEISDMLRADSWRRFKSSNKFPQIETTPYPLTMKTTGF